MNGGHTSLCSERRHDRCPIACGRSPAHSERNRAPRHATCGGARPPAPAPAPARTTKRRSTEMVCAHPPPRTPLLAEDSSAPPRAPRDNPPPPPQSPASSGSTWDADGPGGSARGSGCRKAHAPRTRRTRAVGAAGADVLRAVTGRAPGTEAARCIAFVCGCRASGGMDYSIANVCRGGRVCEPPNLVDTTGDDPPPPPPTARHHRTRCQNVRTGTGGEAQNRRCL